MPQDKPVIGICIPTPQMVYPDFAIGNLLEIIAYTKKHVTPDVLVRFQGGVRTDKNRNVIVKELLEAGADYILHLDADMIFPADIIERYLVDIDDGLDVGGCLYFKRSYPHDPIGYILNKGEDKKEKPYRPMLPQYVHRGKIYHADGVGFGGMIVAKHVYQRLGKHKWSVYGKNFHIPEDGLPHALTHDLQFCKRVKEKGMTIKLHGSIRPGHIGTKIITEEDYKNADTIEYLRDPSVLVIMPAIDEAQADKTAKVLKHRAGMSCQVLIAYDKKRNGFVKTANDAFHNFKDQFELFVYTAQDVFVNAGWLKHACHTLARDGAGLVAFNDGKWGGRMAQFGLVERRWALDAYDNLLPPQYTANYCDVELSQVAKQEGRFSYADKAIMMEIDYQKDFTPQVNMKDKKTYAARAKKGFDGKVTDRQLLKEFS